MCLTWQLLQALFWSQNWFLMLYCGQKNKMVSFYFPEETMSHFTRNVLVYGVVPDKCTLKVLFVENQKDFGNLLRT